MVEVSAILAKMQSKCFCPVCLDYLNDPVTTDCGHNFCDSCIRMSWKDLQDTFPCPVCQLARQEMRISANAQLGRLVDLAKRLHSSGSSKMARGEEHRHEDHRQGMSLFCEDDQALLCPLCARCLDLQCSVEEATSYHRQRLKYIKSLEKRLAKFVESEQEAALRRLSEEEKRLQQQLRANLEAYSDHIWALKDLRREVAERSVMSEEVVLRGVRGLQQRWAGLQAPAVQPLCFRPVAYSLPPLCSALKSIIRRFRESISLDPDTSHPSLRVSKDKKSVTWVRKNPNLAGDPGPPEDAAELVVLGREGFASGRHYWEMQVGAKPEWAVGVCSVAPSVQASRPLAAPKRCWTLQPQDRVYLAVGAWAVPLALRDQPPAIGVYLDWELGQLSFYNAASDRSHLHSFTEPFAQEFKPYFRVGRDCTPLSVGVGRT
ncbi:tripartite motif-containing protein 75-like [Sorex fumeus]|uniref:tripartite motif-containing protein 75-like n=1 Tax=Sorex fumeus TaxID=62283 RepID=UPI0024AD3FFE|nr:tripartite motif-containing protein 75-like [Sorex fumeus]